jgi:hypothetical protein
VTEQRKPFATLGYEPVPAIINKLIARYLRTQRKNMRRFFAERGLFDLADRMNQIRRSRQGMLAKNRYFQEVLNEYAQLATPANPVRSTVPGPVPGAVLQSPPVVDGETEQAEDQ